jgi:exonuclease III
MSWKKFCGQEVQLSPLFENLGLLKCSNHSFVCNLLGSRSGVLNGGLKRVSGRITKHFVSYNVVFGKLLTLFFMGTSLMISLTIYLMLLRQSVERNPGPKPGQSLIPIVTYNTNGLGSKDKFKRLMTKLDPLVSKGGIIMLQETHTNDSGFLRGFWKHKFSINCNSSNSAGLLIMYCDQYKLIDEFSDGKGRLLIVAIKKEEEKFIVVNSYYPNDHRASLDFASELYERVIQFQQRYPDFDTTCAGDLNICISKESDSLNRNRTKAEALLADLIVENHKIVEVTDAYRAIVEKEGYTWRRGDCYSRLDYIFLSKSIKHRIASANTGWAFERSDHAAVLINLFTYESPRGPGLTKVNTRILDDPETTKQIGYELEAMLSQSDPDWNPHTKLEFLKVCIRSVFASKVSERRSKMTKMVAEKEEELNQLESLKIEAMQESKKNNCTDKMEKIESALLTMRNIVNQLREKLSETLSFTSRAKWFEYGERSNKFFLNLNKQRQKQKHIERIKSGNKTYEGQKEVTEGVKQFYQELYKARSTNKDEDNSFYDKCPKLSEENSALMEKNLSLCDLEKALRTCKDSAPGPDGIPYDIYRKFWKITGQILLDAWNYSMEKGKLPPSHEESVITLLPKEGKDAGDIKNWRPIMLSNCDSKIITKALANKMAVVLNSIVDQSQTAYIPGRAVADNLRSNMYMKRKCKDKNIDSVLISLDAKKAFDSVDHAYISKTLEAYGFGKNFVNTFKILYSNITARILVNSFTTNPIKIERGVKQGDALSCAIFIICIDPVLRNMNNNKEIVGIKSRGQSKSLFKAAAYADDISIICKKSGSSIQQVFNEYSRLTNLSGLELNADKTEILILNSEKVEVIEFDYDGARYKIKTVEKMKICGLYYCTKQSDEQNLNLNEKIKKLSDKIRAWSHRHLTMEGKILIVKMFGLSQLIYNMQIYDFKKEDLLTIERIIFKFLWSNSEAQTGVDRI